MRIKSKIITVFLAGALLPIVLCVILGLTLTARHLNENGEKTTNIFTENAANQFASFFQERTVKVQQYTIQPAVRSMDWRESSSMLLWEIENTSFFEKLILALPNGEYWATSGGNHDQNDMATANDNDPAAAKLSLASRAYFKQVVTDNVARDPRPVISEPIISLSNGVRQLVIAAPIIEQGLVKGMVAGTVSWDQINDTVLKITASSRDIFGEGTHFILITDTGTYAYHWQEDKNVHIVEEAGKNTIVSVKIQNEKGELGALSKKILSSPKGSSDYHDEKGASWELVWRPVGTTGYRLCMLVPEAAYSKPVTTLTLSMLAIMLGGILLIVFLAIALARNIARPIQEVSAALQDIANGEGDLTRKLDVHTKDEIGELGAHFNAFISSLRSSIVEAADASKDVEAVGVRLNDSATSVLGNVSEISKSLRSASEHAQSQGASVTETSSAVHQISRNIESLAERIESQAANVVQSSASIEEMVGNIRSVTANLQRAQGQYDQLVRASRIGREKLDGVDEKVKAVATNSVRLQEANEVIEAVASQTNLLAMNAAIEAAHAGEAGKGFSVVADEIRKLAEDTATQSHEIAENLAEIRSVIDAVVGASSEAGTAFNEIEGLVGAVASLAQEVLQAMSEQNEGGIQVLDALKRMQDVTTEVRDGSREMKEGNATILDEMARLQDSSLELKDNINSVDAESEAIARIAEENATLAAQNGEGAMRLATVFSRFKV